MGGSQWFIGGLMLFSVNIGNVTLFTANADQCLPIYLFTTTSMAGLLNSTCSGDGSSTEIESYNFII